MEEVRRKDNSYMDRSTGRNKEVQAGKNNLWMKEVNYRKETIRRKDNPRMERIGRKNNSRMERIGRKNNSRMERNV